MKYTKFALTLMRVAAIFTLVCAWSPAQAAPKPPHAAQAPTSPGTLREPPTWWYDPCKPVEDETTPAFEQPEWWYVPQLDQDPITQNLAGLNVTVSLPGGQFLNAGTIPLNIQVTADGQTPEIVVQVVSDDVPDRAVYAGHEKSPDGTVQNLGSFQQARFVGGVGTDNAATVQFLYEALAPGWVAFEVQVWVGGYQWYGPTEHATFIAPVTPGYTSASATVSLPGGKNLNAGAFPLDIAVTSDGHTPEIIVQVVSDGVPDRAVFSAHTKTPNGAIQNLGGFQQARFAGGVGSDNTASVQFEYEAVVPGWVVFEVQVWAGGSLIYGPQDHAIFIATVLPTFTSMSTTVNLPGSQGLNVGLIPLDVEVTADGQTPEVVVQVVSNDVPERVAFVSYEKTPGGAVQNLGRLQQARFVGGVGPGNSASVQFQYETLVTGWVVFEVQVWIGGYQWYGPQNHAIYIRPNGIASLTYPPRIDDFGIGTHEFEQVSFDIDVVGNPTPQYSLECGSPDAEATLEAFTCFYRTFGHYTATLIASNFVEGSAYSDVATARVVAAGPLPDYAVFLPTVMRGY